MHRSGPVRPKHTPAARLRQCDKQFWSARQAIAATEFALVLPILVILMLGSVEAARLIISAQRVTQVATTIVEMLSQTQAQNPNETGTGIPWSVTYLDLDFAIESTMVIFPQILQDAAQKGISWSNDISISMAGVLFTPNPTTCTSNCSYIANVVWNSGPNKRTCGVALTAVPDTSVPSKTTLPTDVFPTGAPPGGGVDHRRRYPLQLHADFWTWLLRHDSYRAFRLSRAPLCATRRHPRIYPILHRERRRWHRG